MEKTLIIGYSCSGCQDIDDALHARALPNGNIEAGVREYHSPTPRPRPHPQLTFRIP